MRKLLTNSQVREIVELYHLGMGCTKIGKRLDISVDVCRAVLRGRNYREVTGGRIMYGKRHLPKLSNG